MSSKAPNRPLGRPRVADKHDRKFIVRVTGQLDDEVKRVALAEGNSPASVIRRLVARGLEDERRRAAAVEPTTRGTKG